jgi:hypothetical protein
MVDLPTHKQAAFMLQYRLAEKQLEAAQLQSEATQKEAILAGEMLGRQTNS